MTPSTQEPAVRAATEVLTAVTGLRIDGSALARIRRCVRDAVHSLGTSPGGYAAALDTDPAVVEDLIDRVTVQESWFFRDAVQIDALVNLLRQGDVAGPVWSMGCGNGQEPLSLVMAMAEAGLAHRVVATDVSRAAAAATAAGRFDARQLRGLSHDRQVRWLEPVPGGFQARPSLLARIDVLHHNLVGDGLPDPAPTAPAAVFLRNVLIYLRPEAVRQLIRRLAAWLPVDSWLFLGPAESLAATPTASFQLTRIDTAFVHRRVARSHRSPKAADRRRAPARAPAAGRAPLPAPRPSLTPVPVPDDGPDLASSFPEAVTAGRVAVNDGRLPEAIHQFRRATYLQPDDPVPHLELAIVLERAGDLTAARRALAAAAAALERNPSGEYEGYEAAELQRLIAERIEGLRP